MPINIACPQCQSRHQVADQMAGQQARCRCGHVISIPARSPQPAAARPNGAPAAGNPAAAGGTITFQCPSCKRTHNAQAKLAGSAARCSCGTVIRVPGAPAAVAAGPSFPAAAASGPAPAFPQSNLGSLLDQLTPDDWERARGVPKVQEKSHHGTDADVLKRHLVPESKSTKKKSGDRPVGLTILSVLHFLGAAGALGLMVLVVAAAELARRVLEQVNLPVGAVIAVAAVFGVLAVFNVVVGVALLMREPWGWWVGTFAYAMNVTDRAVSAVSTIIENAGAGGDPAEIGGNVVGGLISISIGVWLLTYFFKDHIREHFKMTTPLKTAGPIAVGAGAGTGIILAILALVALGSVDDAVEGMADDQEMGAPMDMDGAAPGMGMPGASDPGMGAPGAGGPGMTAPGAGGPGMSAPGGPGMAAPGAGGPGMTAPGAGGPGMPAPGMAAPGAGGPGMSAPGGPGMAAPGAGGPGLGVPGAGAPIMPNSAQP